ncbi:tetratricopeptide repeat protein [Psychrobacillus sp. INOP01]|uniref:tetratricopeptide repeat protein n=1 Tax=Psychrobacillus sp. INOP01 TaxID=2829187 RepID=UPI001BAAD125|nr:tetratricopeptide repeat protein [Psychrobacillus sp. INOP01]QUG43393.1 tetratricopeptide repeat protein [Psychrobacillus sp. INOP01]
MKIEDLKKKLGTLQSFIYFDENNFLREKCSDEDVIQNVISEFESAILKWSNPFPLEDLLFFYGTIGNLYRIKGEVKPAIEALSKAVELSEGNNQISNLIRLGEALKYAGKHQQALSKFNAAIDQCAKQENSQLLDFAYQHKGKCLLEIEEIGEADECFRKAMDLRVQKGDESLIDSTQRALNFIKRYGGLE